MSEKNNVPDLQAALNELGLLLKFIFSIAVITMFSVICSGKLLARCHNLNIADEECLIQLNLKIVRLKASGDEVIWGLTSFILSVFFLAYMNGRGIHLGFTEATGIKTDQWTAICAVGGGVSLILASFILLIMRIFKGVPVVSSGEREQQIAKLEASTRDNAVPGVG